MNTTEATTITIGATINAPVAHVWDLYTSADDVTKWNSASDDWHTTKAENDLRVGGNFLYRMEAKDGSFGFDFGGVYTAVTPNEYIGYTIGDGRKVQITFTADGEQTQISSTFEAEDTHTIEQQQSGWQSILDNFKRYVESRP